MSSCKADEHKGFKVFLKGEGKLEVQRTLFMCSWCKALSEDICGWRRFIYTLSLVLSWFCPFNEESW